MFHVSSSADGKSARLVWPYWVAWLGLVALVGYVVTMILGIYQLGWQGSKTSSASRWLPLPVAMAVGHPLSATMYFDHARALTHYAHYVAITSPTTFPNVLKTDQYQAALTKIIRDQGAFSLLRRYNLVTTSTDVDQAFSAQLVQNGDRQQVTSAIKSFYGWQPAQFKQNVIRPVLAREKLREKLSFDDTLNSLQRNQAESVFALVSTGDQPFEDLAKTYSEDSYAPAGGDFGFFPRGQQLKEIDDAAFNLDVNHTSDLIHTKYGWHILQLLAKKVIDGQDQVHVRQIFIAAPNVDDFITHWLSGRVSIFIHQYAWDNASGQAGPKK